MLANGSIDEVEDSDQEQLEKRSGLEDVDGGYQVEMEEDGDRLDRVEWCVDYDTLGGTWHK